MDRDNYKDLFDEQIEVIMHEKGNILVSASAGSGKTFVMIKRIVRLVALGKASIKDILAITFTDAAAKEMKEKLAAGIEEEIKKGCVSLAYEAADLPYADVCTIDSFCARLLRRFFFKAGVSPDFSVADAATSEKLKNEAVNKTFREFYVSGDENFRLLIKRFSKKRKDDLLKSIVLSCYEFLSTEEDVEKFKANNLSVYTEDGLNKIKAEYLRTVKNRLTAIKAELIELKNRLIAAGLKKGAGKADDLAFTIDYILSLSSPYDIKSAEIKLRSFDGKPDFEGLKLKKEIEIYKNRTQDIIDDAAKFFVDESADLNSLKDEKNSAQTLYFIIEKFAERYSALKTDENVLDFNDLERLSLDILKDESVRAELKEKYKYIFIDEYQDVNGIQEAIVNSIAKNNVFMVGDVKQSIYGFRGCRSDFFINKFEKMKNGGETVKSLNRNFRSSDAVIFSVNDIFSYAMVKDVYGSDYVNDKLIRGGAFPDNSGRFKIVRFFPDEKTDGENETALSVYDVLKDLPKNSLKKKEICKEARLIAKIIADELKRTYYDVKTKSYKPVKFKDIAILSRVGAEYSAELIEGLIALGVPVTTDGDVSVLNYPEVIALICLLKVLRNFYDDVSLATVMKSPFGRFTDEDLTEIALSYYEKNKNARFSDAVAGAKNLPEPLQNKVELFKSKLDRARFLSDFLPVGETLERLIDENDYYAFLAADENGDEKTQRVKFFVKKALSFTGCSLSDFISLTKTAEKAFRTGGGAGGDAVKFATVHSSKGLEYPVVILRGIEKSFAAPKDLDDKILKDREFGFAVKRYDDENMTVNETPFTGLVRARIKNNAVPEEMRLFYVALTRARQALYLTFKGKREEEIKGNSYLGLKGKKAVAVSCVNFIPDTALISDADETELALNAEETERREVIFPTVDKKACDYIERELSFKYPFLSDTSVPLKISVTAAMKGQEEYSAENFGVYADFLDAAKTDDTDATDAERGDIAHKIMELYDFTQGIDVEDFAKTLVEKNILLEGDVEKINFDKLRRALNGGAFEIIKGKKLLREKNFIVSVSARDVIGANTSAPVVLQGKIDLLAIGDDGAYVIDYKYSAHGAKTLKERYAKQLDLYAYAVEKSLNVKVKGKYIISLLSGETVAL